MNELIHILVPGQTAQTSPKTPTRVRSMNGSLVRYLRRKTEEHVTSPQTGHRPPLAQTQKHVDLLHSGDLVLCVHRAEPPMDLLQDPEETTMTSHSRTNNRRVCQTRFTFDL